MSCPNARSRCGRASWCGRGNPTGRAARPCLRWRSLRHPPARERADRADGGDALALDEDHAVGQWRPAETVNQATAHQRERARLSRCQDETESKRSDEVRVHEMELLTNQIVMKLMFKPKVAALRLFESKVTSSIQNQKSSIG